MKKFVIFTCLVLTAFALKAQEGITVKFTSTTQIGAYCPFNVVNVSNLSRGWEEVLVYPDTTLLLANSVGIPERLEITPIEVYPNPFSNCTNAFFSLETAAKVKIQLLQLTGKEIASCVKYFEAGKIRIMIMMSEPQMALLVVTTANSQQVAKVLNIGNIGNENFNDIVATHYSSKNESNGSRANFIGDFMPGDTMRYEAVSYDNGNVLTSAIITKAQYEDETIVLGFTVTYAEVHTLEVSNITQTSAVGGGEVTLSGGLPVIERGICWSTTHNPTVNENHNSNGNGIGAYSVNMYGLTQNTTYYVRAYATNGVGISYGQEMHFTTSQNISAPTVITSQVTNISQNTAIGGGNVTTDGGVNVTERGICWSSGHNPTINNSHSSNGSGLGSYTVNMTSLSAGTLYYVRAYAINSQGISYGQEVSFTTAAELPTVSTSQVSNITQTTATGGGNVTNDGGANVTVRGVCWSTNHNPTISDSHASNGTGTGNYSINITGLTANTTYYVRAYATNSVGTAYGSEVSFTTLQNVVLPTVTTSQVTDITQTTATGGGNVTADGGGTVTERGICWSVNHSPTISGNHASSGTGIGSYTVSMTNLTANTTYYVRAYATNSTGTAYGSEVSFTTLQNVTLPSVTTSQVIDITQTTATGGGNVTADGGGAVVERGICWSTNHNPTTSSSHSNNGTGTGSYTVGMTGLTANTIYYVRAYATNSAGTAYGSEVSFTTLQNVTLPTVTTSQVTNIAQTTATGGGNVTSDGGATVTERGICWSTNHNPTTSGNHGSRGTGTGSYSVSMTGLTANTTYYVRAYATNSAGTAYGSEVSFTTLQEVTLPTVTTSQVTNITQTSATGGGNVTSSGGGTVTERGICWSTSHNPTTSGNHGSSGTGTGSYSVSMTGLTANTTYYVRAYATNSAGIAYGNEVSFTTSQIATYTITVSANPNAGGSVSGGGTYQQGQSCTVTATAATGYTFYRWTENGTQVSTNASYTFTVNGNRILVANFTVPTGAINGKFTINTNGDKVYFSQGNLQYQASTNTWRFAGNQYSCIGNYNSYISSSYSGWIDLFGWSTSGYNHGAVCYQPWSTSENYTHYYAYGSMNYNLFDQTGQADWGYNPISNGGNTTNTWRTLTINEWSYVLGTRITPSGIRYAKAKVNNVNGVILLPDDWNTSYYSLSGANMGNTSYDSNVIGASQWTTLEQHGAVFLPATGFRLGTDVYNVGSEAYYWSASYCDAMNAHVIGFDESNLWYAAVGGRWREFGQSIRLVCPAEYAGQLYYSISVSSNPVEGGVVNGGGNFLEGETCTVSAIPNTNYTFVNWTENGSIVSSSINYTFIVTNNRTLVANFNAPTGAINGKYTINSSGGKVYFSQGNLQYRASTNSWQFAENQYDCIGNANSNISPTYSGWIDLFGWGTSGWNNGNTYYHPWDTNENGYYYGPPGYYHLTGSYANSDWGVYNTISNGGTNQWRTLTQNEWDYVFNTRSTSSGKRYAKAKVNNVNGVILLPDNWNTSTFNLFHTNENGASFNSNVLTASQWVTLENAGAVFLPAAGSRSGTTVGQVGSVGYYWSASCYSEITCARLLFFVNSYLITDYENRAAGCSVRLVCHAD